MRALLLVLLVAAPVAAEPLPACPTVGAVVVPPWKRQPDSASSLRASKRRAELPLEERCQLEEGDANSELRALALLEALRIEPANLDVRLALADTLGRYLREDTVPAARRPAVAAAYAATLASLRDGAWDGCAPCVRHFVDLRFPVDDAPVVAVLASVAGGPPGPLAAATRKLVAGLAARWNGEEPAAWAAAQTLFAPRARLRVDGRSYRDVDAWFEKLGDSGFPSPGGVMLCSGRCCRYPLIDDRPHKLQLTEVCFDGAMRVLSLRTADTGM